MGMSVTQVRLPDGLIREIDILVEKGFYATKSDVVRDAVRSLILEKHIGSITDKGNSVKQVRLLRRQLSKENFDINEINKLRK